MADIVTSQTRIVNRTLILLGSVERLVSVDDPVPLARQIKDLWHESRRTAIAAHPWNFALWRVQLNVAAEVPAFGYARKFLLPADNLRWLPPARDDCDGFEGEEEGGFLLSDADAPLNVRYIRDMPDVTKWPAHFATMMAYQLGLDLAESATQIQANVEDMQVKWDAAFAEARRVDGLASGTRSRGNVQYTSRWLSARRDRTYNVPG